MERNAGSPPTPTLFAITPISLEIIPVTPVASMAPTNGYRYFRLIPNIAGSVTPRYPEINAGTPTSFAFAFLLLMITKATTAEAWAILLRATTGKV